MVLVTSFLPHMHARRGEAYCCIIRPVLQQQHYYIILIWVGQRRVYADIRVSGTHIIRGPNTSNPGTF